MLRLKKPQDIMLTRKLVRKVAGKISINIGLTVKICSPTKKDIKGISKIDELCWNEADTKEELNELEETIKEDTAIGFVAKIKQKSLAYILGQEEYYIEGLDESNAKPIDEKTFYLSYVAVVPKFQRKGIYSLLWDLFEIKTFKTGYRRILSHSEDKLESSKAHLSKGFRKIKLVKDFYDDGGNAWLMEKRLYKKDITEKINHLLSVK